MTDILIYGLLAVVGILLVLGILIKLVARIDRFSNELRYYSQEISRTDGAERQYWRRKRRRLWRRFLLGDRLR